MSYFSIIIVAKNAEHKIARLLASLQGLSDDVVVIDTGSTDATAAVAEKAGASVQHLPWKGYGKSKNEAIAFAKYDWVLSLDSDEKVDAELYQQLKNWKPGEENNVHQVLWKNYLGDQWIRHSDWGNSWKKRLFNKHVARWDDAIAHEDLTSDRPLQFIKMDGYLEHYSFTDNRDYAFKMINSAMITAEKYHQMGKKAGFLKLLLAPGFSFLKTYIFKFGFLDGHKGWLIAKTTSYYTFIKYARLKELNAQ